MITNILLEMIPPGALSWYDISDEATHFVYEDNTWVEMQASMRLRLPMNIDTELTTFEPTLRRALAAINRQFRADDTGTLLFAVHASAEYNDGDHMGHLLIAGMAFLPHTLDVGARLNGEDPVPLIMGLCRGHYDHPIVAGAVAAQRARRYQEARRHQELARQAERDRGAATRALKLLHEFTTPEQQAELEAKKHIHVRAQNGELFRIDARDHQNVYKIVDDKPVVQYCIVIGMSGLPTYDLMLAQKLLLETNVAEFFQIANQWDLTTPENQRRANRANGVIPDFGVQVAEALAVARERYLIDDLPVVPTIAERMAARVARDIDRQVINQVVEVVNLRERAHEWGIDIALEDDVAVVQEVRAAG